MGYIIRNTNEGSFLIDEKDLIGIHIHNTGVWEPKIEETYKRIIQPEYLVINVGANMGYHTIKLATIANKVIAFEPQRKIYNQLCSNIYLNEMDNKIKTYRLALGDVEEELNMTSVEDNPSLVYNGVTNYGGFRLLHNGSGEEVKIKTLDSFNFQPDFILMDAEGYEFMILKGALSTLNSNKPTILFESWENQDLIFHYLKSLGYDIFTKDEIDYNYIALHPEFKDSERISNELNELNFSILDFSYEIKELKYLQED
jgi:FkbM family methyltransferase